MQTYKLNCLFEICQSQKQLIEMCDLYYILSQIQILTEQLIFVELYSIWSSFFLVVDIFFCSHHLIFFFLFRCGFIINSTYFFLSSNNFSFFSFVWSTYQCSANSHMINSCLFTVYLFPIQSKVLLGMLEQKQKRNKSIEWTDHIFELWTENVRVASLTECIQFLYTHIFLWLGSMTT